MDARREMLEDMLERYEQQLEGLDSYIKELKAATAKHGTENSHFEEDVEEAEHNISFYKGEVARIKKELGNSGEDYYPRVKAAAGAVLPQTAKQGIGYLILASVSFVAGAILGSNLMSGGGNKDRQSE